MSKIFSDIWNEPIHKQNFVQVYSSFDKIQNKFKR